MLATTLPLAFSLLFVAVALGFLIGELSRANRAIRIANMHTRIRNRHKAHTARLLRRLGTISPDSFPPL